MTVSFTLAAELKNVAAEKFNSAIHFHDGCGGQFFTVDEPSEELKNFITEFLAEKNMKPVFSDDGTSFTL